MGTVAVCGGGVGTLSWGQGATGNARGQVNGSLAGTFDWSVGEGSVNG